MKRKVIALISFLSFWFSIIAMFAIAGSCDAETITIGQAIRAGLICIGILIIDVIVVNKNFQNGEWRC